MSLSMLALGVVVLLMVGYRTYGRFVAGQYRLDSERSTPATMRNDGVDFIPTRPFYLFGQHFSAIAAAGPIAGPILAAQQFGWLPALCWIVVGVIFIGAVHDLSALVASVRHDAKSIAEVVRLHIGARAGTAMLIFIWVALVYVIVAFTDVTATTFVQGDPDLKGLRFDFHPGNAVAMASVMYLALSLLLGVVEKWLKPPLWLSTVIFVPLVLVVVFLGTKLSGIILLDARYWTVAILIYCAVASVTPAWLLLQPRGYLGGFVLYLAVGAGTVGLFFGGFDIVQPAFVGFSVPGSAGTLFPFLFVTIACGACSGFHGLVCSGTTSKQIANEKHCHPVGYGAMLMEGFVAVIALSTVMIVSSAELQGKAPGTIYGIGIGRFLTVLIGEQYLPLAITFGAMAFSTFVFDTLDVSTRLGRFIIQELTGWTGTRGVALATLLTVGVPLVLVLVAPKGSWRTFWTLFGTSNQLLAALSLLGVSVWLKKDGRRFWFTLTPAVLVAIVTLSSLALQCAEGLTSSATVLMRVNALVAALLGVLAVVLFTYGARALMGNVAQVAPA
jgi:carbon starvation protein